MKSIIKGNREINCLMLSSLLYPIRWTQAPSDEEEDDGYREPIRQYYHKFSLEAMSLDDVFQYLESRCNHANVYFPARDHHHFKELARYLQSMVQREDLDPGSLLTSY
jgi:hypothetical protein